MVRVQVCARVPTNLEGITEFPNTTKLNRICENEPQIGVGTGGKPNDERLTCTRNVVSSYRINGQFQINNNIN